MGTYPPHHETPMKNEELIMKDPLESINHPSHYQGKKFEVIDIIEDFDLNFTLGNAIKYILRAGKKNRPLEDLKKAMWYLEREVSHCIGGKHSHNDEIKQ